MHDGQLLDPAMRDIESFLESSQKRVTGTVKVKLNPYHFEMVGIESVFDLMSNPLSQYGEQTTGWTGDEAKAFAKILSNQTKIYHSLSVEDNV
jgi:argininosuccinate synthase